MTVVDDDVITPESQPDPGRAAPERRWRPTKPQLVALTAIVATGFAVTLSLLRTPGYGATDTIWAEDARQFYQGSLERNYLSALFTPYNGYLHFIPRTLIEIVRIFPLAWASTVIAVMGALATSSCALLIYRASARHLRSPALRIAVAVPVALPYIGQLELANNFACIHFLLLYVAFWMVIWNPVRPSLRILAAFVLFATVGSDPVAAIYLPLAFLRYRTLRGWRGALPAIGIAVGLVFQSVGILFRNALHGRGISPHYDPFWATKQFFETVIGQSLYTEHLNQRLGYLVPAGDAHYLAWALVAAVLLLALARLTKPNWPLVIAALVHSLLLFDGLAMQGGSDAPRYELPAICLLLVAVAGTLIPHENAARQTRQLFPWLVLRSTPAFAALALVALCIFGGYAQDMSWRAKGPSFDAQLSQAAVACQDKSVSEVAITVAPAFATWSMTVPCDLVRDRNDFFQLSP
ncbi:MAG: hypothetical protein HOW97_12430 [Catenulispora sp.]|nr:hypothetical protein [Catenulispora sp.]